MDLNQELIKQLSDQKYALDQAAIVAATDAEGLITYVNDKFCEISGYSRPELIGLSHRIINSGIHPQEFFEELWKTIRRGKVWQGEVCNRRKNGSLYWVHTTIVPFIGEDGKPTQYLAIRHEITALKEAQNIITEQQERLVAASRLSAIGEMAAAITHEINNPLGVILGRTEMLKALLQENQLNQKELLRLTESIEVTGLRIEKIVRSMKTMAHHQEEEAPQKVLVQEILQDAIDLCLYRFENSGISFRKLNLGSDIHVICRSHQIVQVLVNLFNNAFDAIHEKAEKWVEVDVVDRQGFIEISVTDSGPGIPAEVQAKMFNPFFSTKAVQYGTGIGLSISQSILKKNGGFLSFDSRAPRTRFVLGLPKK